MVRTRLNIGCRYSTPVRERPLHPTRSQFKPEPSQTQARVTPATEPERRAGGGLTAANLVNILVDLGGALGPGPSLNLLICNGHARSSAEKSL